MWRNVILALVLCMVFTVTSKVDRDADFTQIKDKKFDRIVS